MADLWRRYHVKSTTPGFQNLALVRSAVVQSWCSASQYSWVAKRAAKRGLPRISSLLRNFGGCTRFAFTQASSAKQPHTSLKN